MEVLQNLYNSKIKELQAYDNALRERGEKINNIILEVKTKRKANPELTKEDVTDLLVSLEVEFLKQQNVEFETRRLLAEFEGVHTAVKLLGSAIEVEDEGYEKILETMIKENPRLYRSQKGLLVPVNEEQDNLVFTAIEQQTRQPKRLQMIWDSPELQPQTEK
jgi:SHS2 domain-containing protein